MHLSRCNQLNKKKGHRKGKKSKNFHDLTKFLHGREKIFNPVIK